MITTLPVFTLSADGNDALLVDEVPPGPPVDARPAKGAYIHPSLRQLFPLAMAVDNDVQLVTCHIIGKPVSHQQHFLVSGGVRVQTYGMTD